MKSEKKEKKEGKGKGTNQKTLIKLHNFPLREESNILKYPINNIHVRGNNKPF